MGEGAASPKLPTPEEIKAHRQKNEIAIVDGPGTTPEKKVAWAMNLRRSIPVLMPGPEIEKNFGPKIPEGTFPIIFPEEKDPSPLSLFFKPKTLELRPLGPSDLPRAMLLDNLCHQHHWSLDDMLGEMVRPVGLSLGIFKESDLLAMIITWIIQPELHVLNLSVHPDFRRMGLGRRLMLSAMDFARRSGAPICELETKSGDKAAEGLYASLGFVKVGVRLSYYPDGSDALLLTFDPSGAAPASPKRQGK